MDASDLDPEPSSSSSPNPNTPSNDLEEFFHNNTFEATRGNEARKFKGDEFKPFITTFEDLLGRMGLKTLGWDTLELDYCYKFSETTTLATELVLDRCERILYDGDWYRVIGTDGSWKEVEGEIEVGSSFSYGNSFNSWRTVLSNTNQGAELEAICNAISKFPLGSKIMIFTDSDNSLKLINEGKEWKYRDKYKSDCYHIIDNINYLTKLNKQAGGKIHYCHVYSHQEKKLSDPKMRDKVIAKNEEIALEYGEDVLKMAIDLNILADKGAEEGRRLERGRRDQRIFKGMAKVILVNKEDESLPKFGVAKTLLKHNHAS